MDEKYESALLSNFLATKNGLIRSYPSLEENLQTDVIIIGAGVTGALVSHEICKLGLKVIMLDKRHSAQGSTAASTALLQYEIDTPLHKLIPLVGENNAVRSYHLCVKAIHQLENIVSNLKLNTGFKMRSSFQFASYKSHMKNLMAEYAARKNHGISAVELLTEKDMEKFYGFSKPLGLLSEVGAEVDPFKLTFALIQKNLGLQLRVFDNTEVVQIDHQARGVEVTTETGKKVKAKKLIIACGYESQKYLFQKVESIHSTYAIVSEVINPQDFWHRRSMIWETASPYLYLRTTQDNRILVGGKDLPFYNPQKRDKIIAQKTLALENSFRQLFPSIPFKTDYQWAGTFCATKDGLPFIGSIKQRPHTYFALGFGGNGITFSLVAAKIIADHLSKKKNPDGKIFTFDR